MSSPSRDALRRTFDDVAELYDRIRPGYPRELFDDLVELAGLRAGARLVEIGCGTGQATVPLAERGFEIVCVELGERLAAVARRKVARFPRVEVVNAAFETWEPAAAEFDAIVAATSFHWIDPAVRYEKCARLLREDGALAVFLNKHVQPPGGDPFFVEIQDAYEAAGEGSAPPPGPGHVEDRSEEIRASGVFGDVTVRRYQWERSYTADEYVSVLDTYSGHRSLDPDVRERLYAEIRRRIEVRPNGRVRKTYLTVLHVARRL